MNLNKKAQGLNYIAVIIVLVLYGFFSVLAYTIWIEIVSALTAGGFYVGAVRVTVDAFTGAFQTTDYLIVLLTVFLIIGIGLTSYRLATSTAFFIITIVTGIFWGIVSYFFNYIFIQMVTPAIFQTTIGVFPRTMILCTNLHWVMLIEIIVGSLTLYGKKEKGQYLA